MPYAMTDSQTGRKFSKIMKANGIAVFAQTADRGIQLAPGILTVRGAEGVHKPGAMGNFEVRGDAIASLGRMAGAGAVYAIKDPSLAGSNALGAEMQRRIDSGTEIHVKGGAKIRTRRSVVAVPGVRIKADVAAPTPQREAGAGMAAPGAAAMAAARAGQGQGQ